MILSFFLAQLFGIYLLIAGLYYILRYDQIKEVLSDFYSSPALRVVSAVISLLLGLFIILSHSVWVLNWPVLITLIGYASFAKGIANLFFPEWTRDWFEKMSPTALKSMGWATIGLGVVLIYCGFIL
ncbi:MAG: hypothetical protein WD595_01585 [Waddliaceae bacterium]